MTTKEEYIDECGKILDSLKKRRFPRMEYPRLEIDLRGEGIATRITFHTSYVMGSVGLISESHEWIVDGRIDFALAPVGDMAFAQIVIEDMDMVLKAMKVACKAMTKIRIPKKTPIADLPLGSIIKVEPSDFQRMAEKEIGDSARPLAPSTTFVKTERGWASGFNLLSGPYLPDESFRDHEIQDRVTILK